MKNENTRRITSEDVLSMETYGETRIKRRQTITEVKRDRRVYIGPDAVFHFENYETIFHQIHEMLWIEKGGEAQIHDELAAYNPLIPNGFELVCTLMFEIEDPVRRAKTLGGLGGVEKTVYIAFDGGNKIFAQAEDDVDRTNAAGKASSVQFLHFQFSETNIKSFKNPNVEVSIGIDHENYGHSAIISGKVRKALSEDFTLS